MKHPVAFAIVCGALLAGAGAASAGDVAKGKRVFNKCKACHSLEPGKKRIGPSLHGVMGRTSGTAKGFTFSPAMKAAGIVWNEATLDTYLVNPRKMIPGSRMVFPGLSNKTDRDDVIAYLKQAAAAK